jgi:hypothetical protein
VHRFLVHRLRCDTSVPDTGSLVGEWRDDARIVRRKGQTFLQYVVYSPDESGRVRVDSTLYDVHSLAPRHKAVHFARYAARYEFQNHHVSWLEGGQTGFPESRVDSLVRPAFLRSSDILLIQAVQLELLQRSVLRLEFIVVGGGQAPGDDDGVSYHDGLLLLRGSDSLSVPGLGKREAWIIGIGSGFDKQYWIDKQTRQVLAWELAQSEGMCGMRYVRAP